MDERRSFSYGRYLRSTTAVIGSLLAMAAQARAQVILDGTTGPDGALDGPDYQITDDLGTRAGDNLFHSFSDFSIDTGESATFSGPDVIRNVISRVTGSNPSDIDGTLRSTMPDADFYFINPNGVTFGPNATLDVQGSFHVSTADELRFEGGDVFSATTPDSSGFSVAEPRAFGFYDAPAGDILVDRSTLEVGEGETLSLVGGDITVDGGEVRAEAGTVNVLAMNGSGEADTTTGDVTGIRGNILLTNEAIVDTSGDGAGTIKLQSERLNITDRSIIANDNSGPVDAAGQIEINASYLSTTNESEIRADANSSGLGANLSIEAKEIFMGSRSEIRTIANSSGDAGNIFLRSNDLTMRFADLGSNTFAEGNSGSIEIQVENRLYSNRGFIGANTRESATGNAGKIKITAGELFFENEGRIFNGTNGAGDGGDIEVRAGIIVADATVDHEASFHTGIASTAEPNSTGRSGNVFVDANEIRLINEGRISTATTGSNDGGNITINTGSLILRSTGFISAETLNSGDAGNIKINATSIDSDFGFIGASTGNQSSGNAGEVFIVANKINFKNEGRIFNGTNGTGNGGDVVVYAGSITADATLDHVARFHTGIASSAEAGSTGEAGDIIIEAESITLRNGGLISVKTANETTAGKIDIFANELKVNTGGLISSSTFSSGNAGVIDIEAGNVELRDFGIISSSTNASGTAGLVELSADRIKLKDNGQIISVAFGAGDAGLVSVEAGEILIDAANGVSRFLTGITSQANGALSGKAGKVEVEADRLEIVNGGSVTSSSFGSQDAGSVEIVSNDVKIDGGRVSSEATGAGDAGDVVITADNVDIRNGSIRTEGQASKGGRITIRGSEYLVVADSEITSNGIVPERNASLIDLKGKIIALNNSRVTSLTGTGQPITGSGVVNVDGKYTLISSDSSVEASSSVEISGLLNDFSNQLIVLDNQFVDASRLLRERCESGGDLAGSTFVTSGRAPVVEPGDGLQPGFYSGAPGSGEAAVAARPCP